MPDPSSTNSYTSQALLDVDRRYRLLSEEVPELDPTTMYKLASNAPSDAEMIDLGLKTIAAGSMEQNVLDFKNLPKAEQRSRWARMSPARQALYEQNGYSPPNKSDTPLWQAPFAAVGWVADKIGVDSLVENAKIVEIGQWGLDKVSNLADDVAGRTYRVNKDLSYDQVKARIENRLNQSIAMLADEGYAVSETGAEYLKWRLLEDEKEYTPNKPTAFGSTQSGIGGAIMRVKELIENTSYEKRRYQPRSAPDTATNVPDEIYNRFAQINADLKDGKEFSLKPRDAWNRVDQGESYIQPTIAAKIQATLQGKEAAAFNAAIELARGKTLQDYIADKERLSPQTPEFATRMNELSSALDSPDTKAAIEMAAKDQSKVSVGRDFARSLFIGDDSPLFTAVSGAIDAAHIVLMDPFLIGGKALKLARVAKYGISSVEEISEMQKLFKFAQAGGQIGEDGTLVFTKSLDELDQTIVDLRNQIATRPADISKSELKGLRGRLREAENQRAARSGLVFSGDDLARTNRAAKNIDDLVPRATLQEYGLDSFEPLLDANGMPTAWALQNRENIYKFLRDASNELDTWISTGSLASTKGTSIGGQLIDEETGEIIEFAADLPESKFNFDALDDLGFDMYYNDLEGMRHTVARLYDPAEIAAVYNSQRGMLAPSGMLAAVTGGADATSKASRGSGLLNMFAADPSQKIVGPLASKFGSMSQRLAAARMEQANRVGAWADRAARAFKEWEAGDDLAFNRWIDDAPNAISVHNDLLALHNRLKLQRGFGIDSADDIFEYWKTSKAMLNLARGRSTNIAIRGFGAGYAWTPENRLFASALEDVPIVRDRAGLIMLPRYNGRSLARRVLNKVTNDRVNTLGDAIARGMEIGVSGSRATKIAGKAVRGPSKFLYALTRQIPRNTFVDLNDLAELKRFVDSTAFVGFNYEQRQILWGQILGGMDTEQSIRFISTIDEASPVIDRLTFGRPGLEDVFTPYASSKYAAEFFELFDPTRNQLFANNAPSKLFEDKYDDIQRWLVDKISNDPEAIDDLFMRDIASFRRDYRPVVSIATRRSLVENALAQLFRNIGTHNSGVTSQVADDLLGKFANQRYSAIGSDVVNIGSTTRRIGVLPVVHYSSMISLPSFGDDMIRDFQQAGFLQKILKQLNRPTFDKIMSKYWKPAVLLRIGFIPRAVGEEALALLARSGFDAAQAIAGSFALKTSRGPISGTLAAIARSMAVGGSAEDPSFWASLLGPKYAEMVNAVGYESVHEYMRAAAKEFFGDPDLSFSKWDTFGFHANYMTAQVMSKIRKFEYSLLPDRIKAALPGVFKNDAQRALYQKLGYAGTNPELRDWVNQSARALLRNPTIQEANVRSLAGVGHTIADDSLGGFAPTEGKTITVKESGTESYTLTLRTDHQWVEYDLSKGIGSEHRHYISYPYALNTADPSMQASFDAVAGVVTPAEVSEGLLHTLSRVAEDPVVYTQVPVGTTADSIIEDFIDGLTDDFGRPTYNPTQVANADSAIPLLNSEDQDFLDDYIRRRNSRFSGARVLPAPITNPENTASVNDWLATAAWRNGQGKEVSLVELTNDELVSYWLSERRRIALGEASDSGGLDLTPEQLGFKREALEAEYATRIVDRRIVPADFERMASDDEFGVFVESVDQNLNEKSLRDLANRYNRDFIDYNGPEFKSRLRGLEIDEFNRPISIGQIVNELRAVISGQVDIVNTQILSSRELADWAQGVVNRSGVGSLPDVPVRTRLVPSPDDIVSSANRWREDFLSNNPDFVIEDIRNLLQGFRTHAGESWNADKWSDETLKLLTPKEVELLQRSGPESKYAEYLNKLWDALNDQRIGERLSLSQKYLIKNRYMVTELLTVPKRYAQILVGDAPIVVRTFAEQDEILRETIYRVLDNMSRSPELSRFINGSERLLYDVSDRFSNIPVIRAPQPGAKFSYGVMANRSTVDSLQQIYNDNKVEEFINVLRGFGMDSRQERWLRTMFLEWDSRAVNRLIANNERMLNGDYMPFSKIGFTNYDDANQMSQLLSQYDVALVNDTPALAPSGRSAKFEAAPGFVEIPTYMRELGPAREFFTELDQPGFGRWSNEGVIAQMRPYTGETTIRFDDFGNMTQTGGHPIEGVTVDQALRNWANVLVDEFNYYYKSPNGYLHEAIEPSRRGTFGADVFDGIPPEDLPAKIYAPREYVAPRDVVGDLVRKGFDKVINPPILAMVRTPQWIMNFSDGLLSARTVLEGLRDKAADEKFFQYLAKNGADVERIRDLYSMAFYVNGGPLKTPTEFMDAVSFLIKDEVITEAVRGSVEYRLLSRSGANYPALSWARRDKHVEDAVFNVALDRAVEATIPYIDDHSVRSIFQIYVRNIMPFQFAQEAFLKRWVRTVTYSPEAIRRAQLIAHGFTSLPFMEKNADGETFFMVPLSETAGTVMAKVPILNSLWGGSARIPIAVPLSGSVQRMLPGIPNDFGQLPSVSPLIMFPAQQIVSHFPEVAGIQTRNLIRPFTGGMPVKTNANLVEGVLETFMPVQYARMASAIFGGFGRYAEEMNGLSIGAVQQMAAEAIRLRAEGAVAEQEGDMALAASLYERAAEYDLPENATAVQVEKWLDNVRDWSRATMFVKGFMGLLSPSTPKETFEGAQFADDFADLLNYMSLEEATAFFLAEHPERQPYTVFKFDKETAAPLPATDRSLQWMDANRSVMKDYKFGAPWLLPQQDSDDEFSQQAFADQQASGIRHMKDLDKWYKEFKFTSAANIYFPEQEAFYFALEMAESDVAKAELRNRWQIWSDSFKKQHPIFAEELVSNFDTRAEHTLDELKTLLNDPELQKVEHHDGLREMIRAYDIYNAEYRALRNDNTRLGRERKKKLQNDFLIWGSDFVKQNRLLTSFWNTVLIPATNLRRQETLMALTQA